MHEYVGNMHIHTPYSDGTEYHAEIAQAALQAGLDYIIVTDHNMYIAGVEGYYSDPSEKKHVLVLIGEEVHDRTRLPQVNHCLVYNVGHGMTEYAPQPQTLIDEVNKANGMAFLAHPDDIQIPWMTPDSDGIPIPWVDWDISGYKGLEIWNYLSDWKRILPTVRSSVRGILRPDEGVIGPNPATLARWDALLATGQRVVGIGNADAHGTWFHLGPIKRRIYPYEYMFACVNTHILTPTQFSGDIEFDRHLIYDALEQGHAYIGYDIPGDTRGFRYSGHGMDGAVMMGEATRLSSGVTLQTKAPSRAHIKIIRHGEVVAENEDTDALVYTATETGAYRVEVWQWYKGKERCWILSNPIYVIEN